MTSLTQLLNIRFPILQGGMGNISHGELTAAVSNAGGLGTLGVGMMTPQEIEAKLSKALELTSNPIAVNIPVAFQPHLKEIGQLIIDYRIPIVSLSAGNPTPIIDKLKLHGIKIICVVGTVKHAVKACDAGADVIVAEGFEAAGINAVAETTTMTLIPQIADRIDVPIVAAGGIADTRGLLAAMALGASGVQMGTRFIATQEAVVHEAYKQAILQAGDTDTIVVGRTYGKPRRILRTPYADQLLSRENQSIPAEQFDADTDEEHHLIGAVKGLLDQGHINCGQIGGLISSLPTVSQIIDEMVNGIGNVREQIRIRSEF
jgi:enoyl-[acyl-carrier protein] reductase II